MVGSSGEAAVMQFEQQQQQQGGSSTDLAKLQVQIQKRSSENYCNSASMESGSTSAEETTTSSTVVPAAGSCEASMWEGWTSTHDDDEIPTTSSSVSNCVTTTTNMVTLLTACNNGIPDLTNMTSSSSGSTSCAPARVTNNNNFHQTDMISNWLSNFQVDQPSGQPIGNFMEHHLVTDNIHLDHQTTLFAKSAQSSSGYKLSNQNQFNSSTSSCDTDHNHLYGKPRPLQLLRSLGPESPISPLALHNGLPHPFGDCWDAGSQPSSPWPPAHVEGTLKSLGATTLQLLQGGPAVQTQTQTQTQAQTHHNTHMNMMSGSSNSSEAEQLQAAKRQLFRPDIVNSSHLLGSGNHHVYSYYPNHHHDQSHQSNGRMNMVPDHSPDAINILEAAGSSVTRNHVNVTGVPNHTEFFAGPYGTFVSGSSGSGGWPDHQSYSNLLIHGGGGGGGNIGAVRPPKAATEMSLSRRLGQEMNFMRRDHQDRTSTSGSPISSACVTDCQSADQHHGGRHAGVKHHRLETFEALSGHHPEDARSPPPKRPNLTVDAPPPFWSRSPMPRKMQEPMRSIATGYAPSSTMSQLMISSQAMECIAVGPALNTNGKPRARRGSATDPQSVYARHRREKINERLKTLQHLVPNGAKVDIVTMLEEAYNYVKFLQQQIKLLKSDDHYMLATPDHYNGIELGLLPMQQMQGLESNA